MAGFGESLRQAREARKITLQEISVTTKIGTRLLQALEDERFDLLPGGIFNKGFVRSYARCVGLDEEKMVAAYIVAANVPEPEVNIQQISTQVALARDRAQSKSGLSAATAMGVVALLVALGLGAVWLREQRKEARESAPHSAVQAATPVPAVPPQAVPSGNPNSASDAGATAPTPAAPGQDASTAPSPSTPNPTPKTPSIPDPNAAQNPPPKGGQGAASTVAAKTSQGTSPTASQTGKSASSPSKLAAAAAPVEISISATQRAWISVRSDDKAVETVTLDPDKPELRTRSFKANDRLLLVLGNPAGVTVTYNGKPAGKLGAEGQRATVTFTPKGIEKQ